MDKSGNQKRALAVTLMTGLWLLAMSGCSTYFAVEEQQELARANCLISGTVTTELAHDDPMIVGLIEDDGTNRVLVDYFVLSGPGKFFFPVAPGTYQLAAFVDLNSNGRYESEPAIPLSDFAVVQVGPGESREDLVLVIPEDGRFHQDSFSVSELMARTPVEQQRLSLYSLCVVGEVTSLDDPRFLRENAEAGMWKFYDFLLARQCGVFFLEPYSPDKDPILFVHGINGTPLDFESIIHGLDRSRFQPWVFYYPSGAELEHVSGLLLQLLARLSLEYPFGKLDIVAHSMGGLVSREFVLQACEAGKGNAIRSFTTIASPLGGMPSAGMGVEHSPVVVSSWRDLDPRGTFQKALFYRQENGREVRRAIPDSIPYHLVFTYGGDSGDGVVKLTSQLRYEAQHEAESIRGFEEGHASVLHCPEMIDHLNRILIEED